MEKTGPGKVYKSYYSAKAQPVIMERTHLPALIGKYTGKTIVFTVKGIAHTIRRLCSFQLPIVPVPARCKRSPKRRAAVRFSRSRKHFFVPEIVPFVSLRHDEHV